MRSWGCIFVCCISSPKSFEHTVFAEIAKISHFLFVLPDKVLNTSAIYFNHCLPTDVRS